MKLHELKPAEGSRKHRNRVGRGIGSGNGKTSGRGHKGQKTRSGGGVRPGFEGGQMPIYRRLPKRGFKNIWAKKYSEVNIETLEKKFDDGETVNPVTLIEKGVLKNVYDGVRILGNGELTKKLNVVVNGITKSAAEKIKSAGGTVEIISRKSSDENSAEESQSEDKVKMDKKNPEVK